MTSFSIKNLNKSYNSKKILENISIDFPIGINIIIGLNGSGKSTFLASILGIVETDSGIIEFDDKKLRLGNVNQYQNIGYLSEEYQSIQELSVIDYLKFLKDIYNIEKTHFNISLNKLKNALDLKNNFFDEQISTLSTGNKKIVNFLGSLIHEPKLLVLDEPFSGLDFLMINRMTNVINQFNNESKIIIICLHEVDIIKNISENVYILFNKNLHQISKQDLKNLTLNEIFETIKIRH